jgi:hypothetical protein
VFLAKDSKLEDNNVLLGIGGSVYEKLGFTDQYHKNKIIQSIVQEKIFFFSLTSINTSIYTS